MSIHKLCLVDEKVVQHSAQNLPVSNDNSPEPSYQHTYPPSQVHHSKQGVLDNKTRGQWPLRLASYGDDLMISNSKLGLKFEIRA